MNRFEIFLLKSNKTEKIHGMIKHFTLETLERQCLNVESIKSVNDS